MVPVIGFSLHMGPTLPMGAANLGGDQQISVTATRINVQAQDAFIPEYYGEAVLWRDPNPVAR